MNSRIWWQVAIYTFLFFVLTTICVQYNVFMSFDEQVIHLVRRMEYPFMTTFFKTITNIGSFFGTVIVWIIITSIGLYCKWHYETIILTVITFITPLANLLMKHFFSRPRPDMYRLIEISGYSYPSGHTMYATSLYGIILILLWEKCNDTWQRVLLLMGTLFMILSIGISRIYLGVHYPSDVIGGFFLSLLLISLTLSIYLIIQEKNKKPLDLFKNLK